MNTFLRELCAWLDSDRFGKKVLFVRNRAIGNQLLRMAANHGVPAVNTVAVPVRSYMDQLVRGELIARGLQKIDEVTASVALQQIMRDVGGGAFTTMGQVELTTASRMLPQLEELEANGLVPSDLEAVGQELLGRVWDKYLNWKKENGYVADAEVSGLVRIPSDVRFAILSNTALSKVEEDFVSSIPSESFSVIRIEVPFGTEPVRNAVFSGPCSETVLDLSSVSCVDCQDVGTEIRCAFQSLLEKRIPAENAVIVCPDEAYGLRVAEEGKLLGIPVDSAFGIPAEMTKGALLVRCMLDFVANGYDVEALTPALISGCMAVYDAEKKMQVFGQQMLRMFRKNKVGWDRERWERFCSDSDEKLALAARSVYGWVRFFEDGPRPVRQVAFELTDLIHGSLRRGREYDFYLNVIDEISRIYSGEMRGNEFLELIRDISEGQRVDTHTADMPGRVYCCSYECAMYVDRPVFFLLGMNWDAFDRLDREFPLLHDREKSLLSSRLRLVSDRAHGMQYAVLELLLNRKDIQAVFCRARMDYIGGEELMAAGIFDGAARAHADWHVWNEKKEKDEVHVPQVNILGRLPLMESDVRMQCGFVPFSADGLSDDGYRERWEKEFSERVWSATGMETACDCPRKFVFQAEYGVREEDPAPLQRQRTFWLDRLARGNLVHEVLEKYFSATKPRVDEENTVLLEQLIRECVERYKEEEVPLPENFGDKEIEPEVEKIRKITGQVIRAHAKDQGRMTVGTEVAFGYDCPVELEIGKYIIKLKGKIDRVDRVGDGYEIVDYKTGSPYWFRKNFDGKLQYYLYTLAWEKLHPDMKVIRASYIMTDSPAGTEPIPVEMTEGIRTEMRDRVTALLDLLADPDTAVLPAYLIQDANGIAKACRDSCVYWDICQGPLGEYLTFLPDEVADAYPEEDA